MPVTAKIALQVELKPSLADDYPTVLREVVKRREQRVGSARLVGDRMTIVLADRLAPSSVTVEQVRAIFESRRVRLLTSSELNAPVPLPRRAAQ